jgi:hypothetical protein
MSPALPDFPAGGKAAKTIFKNIFNPIEKGITILYY